jgi:hypothetical protein
MNHTEEKTEFNHRDLSAIHHEQSARHHHAASVHFESGKDFDHCAHQAILAHGHALKALAYGRMAWRRLNDEIGEATVLPKARTSDLLDHLLSANRIIPTSLNSSQHHEAAAFHHEAAADLERRASSHELASELEAAALDDSQANDHGERSIFHSDEAAKYLSL